MCGQDIIYISVVGEGVGGGVVMEFEVIEKDLGKVGSDVIDFG